VSVAARAVACPTIRYARGQIIPLPFLLRFGARCGEQMLSFIRPGAWWCLLAPLSVCVRNRQAVWSARRSPDRFLHNGSDLRLRSEPHT
jgi:hypothetical protein